MAKLSTGKNWKRIVGRAKSIDLVSVGFVKVHNSQRPAASYLERKTGKRTRVLLDTRNFSDDKDVLVWLRNLSATLVKEKAQGVTVDLEAIEKEALAKSPLLDALETFLAAYELEHTSKVTRGLRNDLKPFSSWLASAGKRYATGDCLTIRAMDGFRESLAGRRKPVDGKENEEALSGFTKSRYLSVACQFLFWAEAKGYLAKIDEQAIRRWKKRSAFRKSHSPKQPLSVDEMKRLLNVAMHNDLERCHAGRGDWRAYHTGKASEKARARFEPLFPLVAVLLLTGCRIEEALHIKWGNVDFHRKDIRIEDDRATGHTVKTHTTRDIGFADSPLLERLLRSLKLQASTDRYVIRGHASDSPKNFRRPAWNRLVQGAELTTERASPHRLRSTSESWLACAKHGPTPFQLAMRFGHDVKVAGAFYVAGVIGNDGLTIEEMLGIADTLATCLDRLYGAKSEGDWKTMHA